MNGNELFFFFYDRCGVLWVGVSCFLCGVVLGVFCVERLDGSTLQAAVIKLNVFHRLGYCLSCCVYIKDPLN